MKPKNCCNKCEPLSYSCGTTNVKRQCGKLSGPTGPTGPAGAIGPTGPAGDDIEVRSTTTLNPTENARVVSSKVAQKTVLDFYIPKGDVGKSEQLKVGNVFSVDPDKQARITDRYLDDVHFLDFEIPRGEKGEKGDKGDTGERGPQGEMGISQMITIDDVEKVSPTDNARVEDDMKDNMHHLSFFIPQGNVGAQGPKGDIGPTGPTGPIGPAGPLEIPSTYILSYNDDPNNFPIQGLEIASGERLPLMRQELVQGDIVTLDSTDNTIQFNKTGVYHIIFSFNGYVKKTDTAFNPTTDFVSVAFREVDSDRIVAGANSWSMEECAQNISGQGIFVVNDIATPFELVNVQKKSMYLNGCNITQTISHSYFSVPMVSITIFKLY